MITIQEWLKQNNVHKSIIEKGRGVVAISVNEDDKPDTLVKDQNTGESLYMKKVTDLSLSVDPDSTRIFVVGADQWKRMTQKNLFISKIKTNIKEDFDEEAV